MPRSDKEYEALAEWAVQDLSTVDPDEFTLVAPQIVRLRNAVAAKRAAVQSADDEITAAVEGMRLSGYSWERIALVLGISRQAAHAQYAEKVEH